MTTRAEIIAEARRWIGTPWQHQARSLGVAVDCIGLVYQAAKASGLPLNFALPSDYDRRPGPDRLLQRALDLHMIRERAPALARVALIRFKGEPWHIGIIGDYGANDFSLIHSYAAVRVAVEHRLDDAWRRRVAAYYDFPGVA